MRMQTGTTFEKGNLSVYYNAYGQMYVSPQNSYDEA